MIDGQRRWVNSSQALRAYRVAVRPQARTGLLARFVDDRRLIRFKLIMLGVIGLLAALLEVPF